MIMEHQLIKIVTRVIWVMSLLVVMVRKKDSVPLPVHVPYSGHVHC